MSRDPFKEMEGVAHIARSLGRVASSEFKRARANAQSEADRRAQAEAQQEILRKNAEVLGSARWARHGELQAAGLLGSRHEATNLSSRIGLGRLSVFESDDNSTTNPIDDEVLWNQVGHMLTCAPTRSGKGASQIIPALLRYPGSCLVMDPKGENYEATAGWRHLQGSKIYRIAPFDKDGVTDAFNPLDYVEGEDDARLLAEMLHPPVTGHAPSEFFAMEAINFLTAVILYVVEEGDTGHRTMATVRELTTLPRKEMERFLTRMSEHSKTAISTEGALALSKLPERRIELFRSLNSKMAVWNNKGLHAATARSDFDFRQLKEEVITIYIQVPFEHMTAYGSFLRIFFTIATNAMLKEQRNLSVPVLFMMDEFPSMGRIEIIARSISYLYGYDVRLWLFTQTLNDLEEIYPDKWKNLVEQPAAKTFMDSKGATAELVSRWLGQKTVIYETAGLSESRGQTTSAQDSTSHGTGYNTGYQVTGRPLLLPDEVVEWLNRRLPDDPKRGAASLCLVNGVRPFGVERNYWFADAALKAMVDRGQQHLGGQTGDSLREYFE